MKISDLLAVLETLKNLNELQGSIYLEDGRDGVSSLVAVRVVPKKSDSSEHEVNLIVKRVWV